MLKKLVLVLCCTLLTTRQLPATETPRVILNTSQGSVEVELYPQQAPITVANFLAYIRSGFYTDTLFHRIIPGYVIQGGGFDHHFTPKASGAPIRNEADNGLHNIRGTLAMARTRQVDSATSQFYINLRDNTALDHGQRDFGYAVFGRVVRGMEVIDHIAETPTHRQNGMSDVPVTPVTLLSAEEK